MTRLTSKQLHNIADWCRKRQMLPNRITGSAVSAACLSLGIDHDDVHRLAAIVAGPGVLIEVIVAI